MITYEDFDASSDSELRRANYLIDLFDGNQLKYVERALDGAMSGGKGARNNWRDRGYVPRMQNIVRPIIEKGGMLFNDPPKYEILPDTSSSAKPVVDDKFNEILVVADFQEFASGALDPYTRLLGAVCLLQQRYIPTVVETEGGIYRFDSTRGDALVPILLHRGNCVIVMDNTRTHILELAYVTDGCIDDDKWMYRRINAQEIVDVLVQPLKQRVEDREVTISAITNPDGFVPASMFYDTAKPRAGVWPRISEDMINAQETLNAHLTDLKFAMDMGLASPLVLQDLEVEGAEQAPNNISVIGENRVHAAATNPEDQGLDLGIGSVLTLKSAKKAGTAGSAYRLEAKVAFKEQADIIRQQLQDLASNWGVRMKNAGDANATSGFQLVVEEMDNLQLRDRRAKAFQAAFRRFYEITQVLYPELTAGELQVNFSEAKLPVNKAEELKLWTDKIANNLASHEDYFQQVEGLSLEEAIIRANEVRMRNLAGNAPMILTMNQKGIIDTATATKLMGFAAPAQPEV